LRGPNEGSETEPDSHPAQGGIVRGSLGRMAFLIALGWLGTNVGLNIGEFVLKFFLKENLHLKADAVAGFFLVGQFTNYIKPVAGLCTDSIPLFRTRRRHYLILSLLGTGLFFLLLIVIPHKYSIMLFVYVFLYMTVVFTSTTLGGVMVEVGTQHKAEGRLTAQRIGMFRLGSLIGGPIGGWLASFPFAFAMTAASLWHLILVPLFFFFLPEAPTATMNTGVWHEAKRQFKVLMTSKTLLSAAGMIFLIAASPGFNTPLLYYQTDTLHFSKLFIGMLGTVAAATGIGATILYFGVCRHLSLRTLLAWSIIVHGIGTLCFLQYHSARTAVIITALHGITVTLATLPVYDLAFRATPRRSEALGYAVMMSVWNLTNGLSDLTGSWLFARFHLTFLHLVWLNAGTTMLVLFMVPILPAALVLRRDGVLAPAPWPKTARAKE
jgi:Na+/melibiose symporter-like transporter